MPMAYTEFSFKGCLSEKWREVRRLRFQNIFFTDQELSIIRNPMLITDPIIKSRLKPNPLFPKRRGDWEDALLIRLPSNLTLSAVALVAVTNVFIHPWQNVLRAS